MLYSVLIYDSEDSLSTLTKEEHKERLQEHLQFQDGLRAEGKLVTVARLNDSQEAVTLRSELYNEDVTDGPFAETKEQLIGFYLVDCSNIDEAIKAASKLPRQSGSIEIRPVGFFEGGHLQNGDLIVRKNT